jgi:hypothetical protein
MTFICLTDHLPRKTVLLLQIKQIPKILTLGGCSPYTETCGMGPGNKLVSTQYLATLDSATAVPTRRSVGVPVCL